MVRIVGMPAVFWIGSVWASVWTAILVVGLLSVLFFAFAADSSARDRARNGPARTDRGRTPQTQGVA